MDVRDIMHVRQFYSGVNLVWLVFSCVTPLLSTERADTTSRKMASGLLVFVLFSVLVVVVV